MPATVPDRKSRHVTGRVPQMSETSYETATGAQIAAALGLLGFAALLIAIWLSNLLPEHTAIPIDRVTKTIAPEFCPSGDIALRFVFPGPYG